MVCGLWVSSVAFNALCTNNNKTPVFKGAPPTPPQRSKLVSSCMNSHRRYLSHRTSKFSSNRHRKLQPFRET
ncbi:uncharacterized protein LOC120773592 [Bactrocera tryoni]|uniref:uncharacterized protein LOC120773592 n=1 Tax=Bactrocera tryoni TaxID=59916 RepID=UPI0010A7489F|nr:uncharacterized protein LOC120773592 [Bactrocera tryoni]